MTELDWDDWTSPSPTLPSQQSSSISSISPSGAGLSSLLRSPRNHYQASQSFPQQRGDMPSNATTSGGSDMMTLLRERLAARAASLRGNTNDNQEVNNETNNTAATFILTAPPAAAPPPPPMEGDIMTALRQRLEARRGLFAAATPVTPATVVPLPRLSLPPPPAIRDHLFAFDSPLPRVNNNAPIPRSHPLFSEGPPSPPPQPTLSPPPQFWSQSQVNNNGDNDYVTYNNPLPRAPSRPTDLFLPFTPFPPQPLQNHNSNSNNNNNTIGGPWLPANPYVGPTRPVSTVPPILDIFGPPPPQAQPQPQPTRHVARLFDDDDDLFGVSRAPPPPPTTTTVRAVEHDGDSMDENVISDTMREVEQRRRNARLRRVSRQVPPVPTSPLFSALPTLPTTTSITTTRSTQSNTRGLFDLDDDDLLASSSSRPATVQQAQQPRRAQSLFDDDDDSGSLFGPPRSRPQQQQQQQQPLFDPFEALMPSPPPPPPPLPLPVLVDSSESTPITWSSLPVGSSSLPAASTENEAVYRAMARAGVPISTIHIQMISDGVAPLEYVALFDIVPCSSVEFHSICLSVDMYV
jgi:hypothetical protein